MCKNAKGCSIENQIRREASYKRTPEEMEYERPVEKAIPKILGEKKS